MWYDKSPILVEVLPLSGYSIKYIGKSGDGLTRGNYYEVLDQERNHEYFYFIDDNNKFVGIRKINYLGGAPNFIEVTKVREDKIKELGI
jgi:hypothetical protein